MLIQVNELQKIQKLHDFRMIGEIPIQRIFSNIKHTKNYWVIRKCEGSHAYPYTTTHPILHVLFCIVLATQSVNILHYSQKKYSRKGKLNEKNSCTPINPKKYSCNGLNKIHAKNLIAKKNSCTSKIPLPPITFLMVRP